MGLRRRPTEQRACDRCYELKERCVRTANKSCSRCNRLKQACQTVRPIKLSGRRPQSDLSTFRRKGAVSLGDASWLKDVELQPEELQLIEFLLTWSSSRKYCILGPGIDEAQQKTIATQLAEAWPVLKDSLLAHASVFKSLENGGIDASRDLNIRRASVALSILRDFTVTNLNDAAVCLTLGQLLVSFVYSTIGMGVADICNRCLSVTKPYIDSSTIAPVMQQQITFLVLMETMDCIVHRQKPTLRIPPQPENAADRYLGLCLPLMPYYHDLCVISSVIVGASDPVVISALQQQLEDALTFVKEWQPSAPDSIVRQLGSAEVLHLLTQAKVYRLAAMLIAHRLRFAFGQEDGQADLLSREILMELRIAKEITGHANCFVTLPFLVAATEIRNEKSRTVVSEEVDIFVDEFTPAVRQTAKSFLARVWQERDLEASHSWFDSRVKPCVVLDSVSRNKSGLEAG